MHHFSGWDWAIFAVAGYLGVSSLVRLMISRRNELTDEYRAKGLAEVLRKRQEEREAAKKAARKGAA